jgi:hypothetical protein
MVQQLQIWRESLGGIDCENCGFSFDEVEITRLSGQALFDVQARLGCMGGAYAEGLSLDELKAWLDAELGEFSEFQDVRKILRKDLTENRPHSVEDIADDGPAQLEAKDYSVDPALEAKWDAEVQLLMGQGLSFGQAIASVGSDKGL